MPHMICYGVCASCGTHISFNPDLVPSIRVFGKGERQPICEGCFHRWNKIHRIDKGLEPIALSESAYGSVEY